MAPITKPTWALLAFVLIVSVEAGDSGDGLSNNLFTDLAPYVLQYLFPLHGIDLCLLDYFRYSGNDSRSNFSLLQVNTRFHCRSPCSNH